MSKINDMIAKNPDFNPVELDGIKSQAGRNGFALTPKQRGPI